MAVAVAVAVVRSIAGQVVVDSTGIGVRRIEWGSPVGQESVVVPEAALVRNVERWGLAVEAGSLDRIADPPEDYQQ